MQHVHEQILDAVVALVTSLSTTGSRVHRNRQYDITPSQLPALNVVEGEAAIVEEESSYYRYITRDFELTIYGYAAAANDVDETLKDILNEVVQALAGDSQLAASLAALGHSGRVWFCVMDSSEMPEIDEKATPSGPIEMNCRVRYRTSATDPTTLT